MPFSYFEHGADIGVEGRGATLEAAFEAAAEATFAVMATAAPGAHDAHVHVEFEEADPEVALVRWLNLLLGEAAVRKVVLNRFRLQREGDRWRGEAWGQSLPPGADRGTEVKGATMTMLSVHRNADEWVARCVVDV